MCVYLRHFLLDGTNLEQYLWICCSVYWQFFLSVEIIRLKKSWCQTFSFNLIDCMFVFVYILFTIIINLNLLLIQGISSSRKLLAESSEEKAIPSPLTPVLAINSGKSEDQNQKVVSKPSKVQAILKGIKQVWDTTFFLHRSVSSGNIYGTIEYLIHFGFSLMWLLEPLKLLYCFWFSLSDKYLSG